MHNTFFLFIKRQRAEATNMS